MALRSTVPSAPGMHLGQPLPWLSPATLGVPRECDFAIPTMVPSIGPANGGLRDVKTTKQFSRQHWQRVSPLGLCPAASSNAPPAFVSVQFVQTSS